MIPKFSVKKPYTVIVGIILALVLGFVSLTRLSADLLPDMNLPYAIVMTTYVGASPDAVESAVTIPLEESMATVSGISSISSTSSENFSLLILEFAEGTNMDAITVEMREKLDQVKAMWNNDSIGSPLIMKINPDMAPIVVAAVDMDGKDQKQLTAFVRDNLIAKLESLSGVASVSAAGQIEAEVQIIVRQDKIDALNAKITGVLDEQFDDAQSKLDEGSDKLKKGREELDAQKQALAQQLAQGEDQVVDGKITAISSKAQLQQQITLLGAALDEVNRGIAAAREAEERRAQQEKQVQWLNDLTQQAVLLEGEQAAAELELQALGQVDDETAAAAAETANRAGAAAEAMEAAVEDALDELPPIPSEPGVAEPDDPDRETAPAPDDAAAPDLVDLDVARRREALTQTVTQTQDRLLQLRDLVLEQGYTLDDTQTLSAALAELTALEEAELLGMEAAGEAILPLEATKAQIEPGYLQMVEAMEMIETGQVALSDALTALNSSGILASIELGSATAQMASAEAQMGTAQSQLDSSRDSAYDAADADKLLSVSTVTGLLTAQNFEMPAGYITVGEDTMLVRVGQKVQNLEELRTMPLINLGMDGLDTIRLEDVADIIVQDNSEQVYAKVNGNGALILSALKQDGYSTGDVSKKLLARFGELEQEYPGLHFSVLSDQGVYIDMVIHSVVQSMLYGAVLAVVVLFLFLKDLRPTLIIAVSIPVSAVLALVFMYMAGVSINMMSLGGLSLGIGMLVDNSVVVLENIYRYRSLGYNIWSAAVAGTREVLGAIIASTLTTVCVFTGLFFSEGIVIDMLIALALSFTFALMGSLIIAMTFVPMMSSMLMRKQREITHPLFDRFTQAYSAFLDRCLGLKPIVIAVAVTALVGSGWAILSRGFSFMPEMASTQASITLTTPKELTFRETMDMAEEAAERIRTVPDVITVGVQSGGGGMMATMMGSMFGGMSGESDANTASFYVVFSEQRTISNDEFTRQVEEKCADLNCTLDISASSMDLSSLSGTGITVRVYGKDKERLQALAVELGQRLEQVEGVASVNNGLTESGEQLKVTIDREKAAEHSLTIAQIFTSVAGRIATPTSIATLELEEGSFQVYVKKDSDQDMDRSGLEGMLLESSGSSGLSGMSGMSGMSGIAGISGMSGIAGISGMSGMSGMGGLSGMAAMSGMSGFGGLDTARESEDADEEAEEEEQQEVRLSDVAEIDTVQGMDTINRYNQQRYLSLNAAIDEDHNVTLVSAAIQKSLEDYDFPDGYYVDYSGESETIMESMYKLVEMLLLAVVCIYLVMVAQFQSLLHPFIIMFTIPLAFTGGFIALLLAGREISVLSMIGFVLLAGVIVNNGIVMIDYINQLRRRGMEKREAILEAGRTRMRPVLMTTLTTVFAQIFMAMGNTMDAALLRPMALVTVGGLSYGTVMTLVFVPCIYDIFTSTRPMEEREIDDTLIEA